MSVKIKNNLGSIITIFLLMQPIIDFITGISIHIFNTNLTFGILIKMLFLLFIIYTAIFVYKKKSAFVYCVFIFLYFAFYILGMYLCKDKMGLFAEIQGLLKTFYFPLLLISLYSIKDEFRISKMALFTTVLLYLLFIFVPTILGVGYKTYEITKVGRLGFYNSANEISGMISLLTPIIFVVFSQKKYFILKILFMIMYLYTIVMMGTKTPLLSLGLTIFATIIYLWGKWIKNKAFKKLLGSIICLIVGFLLFIKVVPNTNFYKNIKTHMDYLKVDSISEVLKNKQLVDHFIFSQRLTFLANKTAIYKNSNKYQKIFGMGYQKDNKPMKMIEIDYFDIYYGHGIVGFFLFFTGISYVIMEGFYEKKKSSYETYMLSLSIMLIVVLALMTGHIITAPSVSVIAVLLLLSKMKSNQNRLLFTSYNLGIGGIENALINLLDKINYDKYKVDLLLEKKEGKLLSKVNNNVLVKEYPVSDCSNVFLRKLINFLRRIWFLIVYYDTYDFSCCYATYSLSGAKLSKISSINSSIYVHSNYKYVYNEEDMRKFFVNRGIEDFRKIIFVSNESKNDFISMFPKLKDKTMVVNNFIDISNVKKQSDAKIDIKKGKNKLFVFVGRLDDKSKKVGRIINLAKSIKNIDVLIVGDGPDYKKYKNLVKESNLDSRVKFLGEQKNPYPYMMLADYIILTSDYEGFPVTYLEAIALGKNIITTIDVSDEELNIGKDYAFIISKDEEKMVEEVKKILKQKAKVNDIDLGSIQNKRIIELEKVFDGVI